MSASRSRRHFVIRGAGAVLGTGILLRTAPAFAQAQQTFKLAFPDSAEHPSMGVSQRFAAALAKRSGGRFKVDIFPGGTLGSETNIVAGLQTGIVDFTYHTCGYVSGYVPSVGALDLPFLFKDKQVAQRVLAGPIGKQLADDAAAKNIIVLGWAQNGWRNVETVDRVVNTPADMAGLKIRIQAGPVFAAMFKQLGSVPVVIDASDLYVALQQKTVDGLEIPIPSTISFKTYEVAKHIALTHHVYNANLFMASKPKMDALSPSDRQIVMQTGAEAAHDWLVTMGKADDEALAFCQQHGSQVTHPNYNDFRTAMAPVYNELKPRYGDLVTQLLAAAS